MNLSELDGYVRAIEAARSTYPQLRILKGMECEYIPEFTAFYQEELLEKWNFDYLIAGNHFVPYNGGWVGVHSYLKSKEELMAYADHMVEAIASGLFAFIAHPDLFGNSYELWDEHAIECSKRILEAAAAYNVPLEVNAYGLRKSKIKQKPESAPYPSLPFGSWLPVQRVDYRQFRRPPPTRCGRDRCCGRTDRPVRFGKSRSIVLGK